MPIDRESEYKNRSKEWAYWTAYYEAMGLGYNKVMKLTHRRMKKY